MNRNDFTGFINGRMSAGEADIPGIRELINLYPWFHSAHLVLLKALKESSDVRFDSQLHESAIYVTDRSMLYSYLYIASPEAQKTEPVVTAESIAEPEAVSVPAAAEDITVPEDATPIAETQVNTSESPAETEMPARQETEDKKEILRQEAVKEREPASSDTDFSTRTREELISEIESRLRELASVAVPADTDQHYVEQVTESTQENTGQILQENAPEAFETTAGEETKPEQPPVLEIEPEEVVKEEPPVEKAEPVKEADDDLLELDGDDFSEEGDEYVIDINALKSSTHESLTQADLIDRFIETSPRIQRMEPSKDENTIDLSVDSVETKNTFITETLARIYISQGYYSKAINIYEKLALQYPEKSAYFASRIEKIKDLIK